MSIFKKTFFLVLSVILTSVVFTGCHHNSKTTLGDKVAYISGSNDPWDASSYEEAMNTVFGESGWTRFNMEDENGTDPFTSDEYRFVYLE